MQTVVTIGEEGQGVDEEGKGGQMHGDRRRLGFSGEHTIEYTAVVL